MLELSKITRLSSKDHSKTHRGYCGTRKTSKRRNKESGIVRIFMLFRCLISMK